jgi:hypothetical protein
VVFNKQNWALNNVLKVNYCGEIFNLTERIERQKENWYEHVGDRPMVCTLDGGEEEE